MAIIQSGMRLTPARLNRLQPASYYAAGTSTVAASSTNADVPSATVTFSTVSAGAVYEVHGVWDFDLSGASTVTGTGRFSVDGGLVGPSASYAGEVVTDRSTVAQTHRGTLAAAGSHTIKLVATTAANQIVQGAGCSILVVIREVS